MQHKTKAGRDYRHEYDTYQGTEQQKKNRAKRNAARALMARKGKVNKGDGKDVDHKTPLAKGGSNNVSNLRVMGKSKNRKRNGQ